MKNWSSNVTFNPEQIVRPTSVADIDSAVRSAEKVRSLGSAHSFNRIADSNGVLLSFENFPKDIEIDAANKQVRVAAGVRYGELAWIASAARLAFQ